MKKEFVMVGSNACPATIYAIAKCREAGLTFQFKNISGDMGYLKEHLKRRETDPQFADMKEDGRIGIPCFVWEDNTATLNLEEAIRMALGDETP